MIEIITCDNCGESNLSIELTFDHAVQHCHSCYELKTLKWRYHFCSRQCMFEWLRKSEIEEKGFPCKDCMGYMGEPTGFCCGYKENGPCVSCKGEKRVLQTEDNVKP
jgi:hypothetical protein